jgi:hypothetical protein
VLCIVQACGRPGKDGRCTSVACSADEVLTIQASWQHVKIVSEDLAQHGMCLTGQIFEIPSAPV